jgi:hypothetical protein
MGFTWSNKIRGLLFPIVIVVGLAILKNTICGPSPVHGKTDDTEGAGLTGRRNQPV